MFILFGFVVSWKATVWPKVALFTTEVEYMSLEVKECIWLKVLLDSWVCTLYVQKPAIYCDSQSTLALANYPVCHERSQHIDIRLNFIHWDVTEKKLVFIEKIDTNDSVADMLIKPLPAEKFKRSLDLVNAHIT